MARSIGWVVSLLSLAAVVWWASQQDAPALPSSASAWGAFVSAIVLYSAVTAVRAERWRVLLLRTGATPARADAHALLWVGYMGNTVLPARAGDAMRAVFIAPRCGSDLRVVIGTLIAERILDVIVLTIGFVVLVVLVLDGVPTPTFGAGSAAVTLAAAVGVATGAVALRRSSTGRDQVRAALGPLAVSTRGLRGRHGASMAGVTVLIWAMELTVWWLCAVAVDLDIGLLDTGYVLALSAVAAMVPAAPGQAGTMDAAVLLATTALDRPEAAALSYLLLLRFVLFVPVTVVGLGFVIARYGGLARLRAARDAMQTAATP